MGEFVVSIQFGLAAGVCLFAQHAGNSGDRVMAAVAVSGAVYGWFIWL